MILALPMKVPSMRKILPLTVLLCLLFMVHSAAAHANLERSNPSANSALDIAPAEIRLWFTEALEPEFSTITLRDAEGEKVATPPAFVDAPKQLVLIPGALPEGVYTVAWKVVSKTDGHLTQGSFSFGIGMAAGQVASVEHAESPIPVESAVVRWLNLLSLALLVGGIGFQVFVWTPAHPLGSSRGGVDSIRLIRVGWGCLGLTTILILLLQVSIVADVSFIEAITHPTLKNIISHTYFGELWVIRVFLWGFLGLLLALASQARYADWLVLLLGAGILWTQSAFSHASSAPDKTASITADWLHLVGMVLWLGGLIHFVYVFRHIPNLGKFVAYFSNYARLMVLLLILTGIYAAWLQVGSIEALTDTPYGQALLIKLLLFLPLLAVAGINLIFTQRGLAKNEFIWQGRLRSLIGVEIALVVGIVLAVGVMTAISPAKTVLATRPPDLPAPTPLVQEKYKNPLQVELALASTWAGENTFTLKLSDSQNHPIEDASRIRLRFETNGIGESELNPIHQGQGVYTARGTNIGVPGEWRIRTTIQRPNTFDTVIDFTAEITATPPPPAPQIEKPLSENSRLAAWLLLGLGVMGMGGYSLTQKPLRLVAAPILLAAGIFFIAAGGLLTRQESRAEATFQPVPDAPIKIIPVRDSELPLLISAGGQLSQANSDGQWQSMGLDAVVRDAYQDGSDIIWAATDDGLYFYQNEAWQKFSDSGAERLVDTHGYLFALGNGEIFRVPSGKTDHDHDMLLDIPSLDQPAHDFVMLGNHSHVLHNGGAVFLTADLGLSWRALDAPTEVALIHTDTEGNLLAAASDGLYIWRLRDAQWEILLPLPENQMILALATYQEKLYAVAGGKLYRQTESDWQTVEIPDSMNAYLMDVAFQHPDTLWVLDSQGGRLWSTVDGESWQLKNEIQPDDSD